MQFHPNELFIYYNPETNKGKQSVAYSQTFCNNIKNIDCRSNPLTTTLWKEILNILDLRPKDLLDKSHPEYQEKIATKTFTMTGWLEVLVKNHHLLKGPIAIYNKRGVICMKPTDVLKLDVTGSSSSNIPPHLKEGD